MKPKVGRILDPNKNYTRDAIHVPIIEVIAMEPMNPGDKIELVVGSDSVIRACKSRKWVGLVDPYLEEPVQIGDKFYCHIKPNTVKDLWHDWTHVLVDKD